MSQTLVKSVNAGARVRAKTSAYVRVQPAAAMSISRSFSDKILNIGSSSAQSDLFSCLRDFYLFDELSAIESWLSEIPELYTSLLEASQQIDRIFGSGRSKWLTVVKDWEGTRTLAIDVEFKGSGEEASAVCRRFVAEWLVNQEISVRQSLVLGVRFL